MEKDLYKVLAINKNADENEIKKAFRKKAMQYHPDKLATATDEEKRQAEIKFKEINEAYQILSDSDKKNKYDRFGYAAFEQGGNGYQYTKGSPGGFQGFDFGSFDFGGFGGEDFFSNMFGGNRASQKIVPGKDLTVQLEITLLEATLGGEKEISYFRDRKTGRENIRKKIKIVPGIKSGQKLKLSEMGDESEKGGNFGDLYIFVNILENDIFKREGDDIICKVPISYYRALQGGEINVPTLYGDKKIRIPKETQCGKRFVMRGMGVANSKTKINGDQYVEIAIEIPVNISPEQKKILKEFNDSLDSGNKKVLGEFLSKVKKFFNKDEVN